jgi:hypothetical protein
MENTMAKAKKKTYRNLNSTPSPAKKHLPTRKLLLTVGNGAVFKIEKIGKSGQRREVSEAEFAEFGGDATAELAAALKHAYTLGFADALKDELRSGEPGRQHDDEQATMRRFIIRRAAGLRRLRDQARKVIFGQALSRRQRQPQKSRRGAAPV